jgi:hypothetical protein
VSETRSIAVLDSGRALRFPRECPHCSGAADTRVRVTKIFARRTRRGIVWIHYHVDVYACATCAREHEAIVRPDSATVRRAARRQALHMLPVVAAGSAVLGGGVLLASFGVAAAGRQTSAIGSATVAALGFGIAGIGLGLIGGGWVARRAVLLPADWPDAQYAVDVPALLGTHTIIAAPVSPLTRAVDFSDDRSAPEEPSWRTFAFARDSYAQEFARLNAQQIYDRLHSVPRSLVRDRRTLYYVAAAALTAAVLWAVWG